MLDKLRERRENEEGFTLIELMVVVLIIAILLAIAIPTFLGARDRANERAAQSSVRNALTAAKVIFTDDQDYTAATASALEDEEPSLAYQAAASANYKDVSFDTTVTEFGAAAWSKSGECFLIRDIADAGGGTSYGRTTTAADCTGTEALTVTDPEW